MPAIAIELERRLRPSALYSSKIIKAGALIGDTKTLLSHWDVSASVEENISRAQRDNVVARRATKGRLVAIERDEQDRRCPAATPSLPGSL